MNISGVTNSLYSNTPSSLKDKESTSFKDVFESAKKSNSISKPPSIEETHSKQWSFTATNGTVWTITDIEASLTASDKAFFGWPSQDQTMMTLAGHVAMDRNEGTLVGDLTKDYLFGNPKKDIFGLIERLPFGELSKNSVSLLLSSF